jgi:hypothetical protein
LLTDPQPKQVCQSITPIRSSSQSHFLSIAGTVELSLTADNKIIALYFDGKQVPVADGEWTQVRRVAMPTGTRTIAVKLLDTGVSTCLTFAATQLRH